MRAGPSLTAASCCSAEARAALQAFVSQAKRERMTMLDVLTSLRSVWSETCGECGDVLDLYAWDGARMCTSCAEPQAVRAFLERGDPLSE
ncbi:MAG TPA: hypothetical protein VFN67_42550 [Polyangiales bacterium]|nr:hypothetical protein [Polyangiales bacterium]